MIQRIIRHLRQENINIVGDKFKEYVDEPMFGKRYEQQGDILPDEILNRLVSMTFINIEDNNNCDWDLTMGHVKIILERKELMKLSIPTSCTEMINGRECFNYRSCERLNEILIPFGVILRQIPSVAERCDYKFFKERYEVMCIILTLSVIDQYDTKISNMEIMRMKAFEYEDFGRAFHVRKHNPLPFHIPYEYTFNLDESHSHHYLRILFKSDCIYNIIFVPSEGLHIVHIDIIDGERTILSLSQNNDIFTYDEEPLMLFLLPYMNYDLWNALYSLQYKISYYGSGAMTYRCQQGYLTEKTRHRYIKRSNKGKIQNGNLVYFGGICRQSQLNMNS